MLSDKNAVIDPIHSLAFSIQANPGVYAVLAGSGVSRAAKIPTGWEVTIDLIRKLAKLNGESCAPDPVQWYKSKFGKEADYSDILDALAKTPAERQQLLRRYWEPTDQEREDGEKSPTAAHRAIAALAMRGFIRVILTTNFDRLLETALTDAGVVPTVLSSLDQVQGALPLIHTQCCVVKVHGDYLDIRIRNTPAELGQYPPEFNQLLERIFDEFGLIVCGWSAEWDGALRKAICRAPSRRFSTYWAARGELGDEAQRLISHRRAQVIPIEDADQFFQNVQQHVTSIEEFSMPHPLSTEAAVASLKRYISGSQYRIQLSDLIAKTVDQVVQVTSGDGFAVHPSLQWTTESVTKRVRSYEAACSTLLTMAMVGGSWAEEEHYPVWKRALERLGSTRATSGVINLIDLQRYPATLLLYALGLGAIEGERLQFLEYLFSVKLPYNWRFHGLEPRQVPAVQLLPPSRMFRSGGSVMNILEDMDDRRVPLNDWICKVLRPYAQRIIPDNNRYILTFVELEMLIALSSLAYDKESMTLGTFCYRRDNRIRIIDKIEDSISTLGNNSPFVICRIFGETDKMCKDKLRTFKHLTSD